jgi:hypothetical protein
MARRACGNHAGSSGFADRAPTVRLAGLHRGGRLFPVDVKTLAALLVALSLASTATAAMTVKRNGETKTLDVDIDREPMSKAMLKVSAFQPLRIEILVSADRLVSFHGRNLKPESAMRAIAAAAKAKIVLEDNRYWIRDADEPLVTLDVKDEDVRTILRSLQAQCRIKNLVIDPEVQAKGTFLFRDLPCPTAFDTVMKSLGLSMGHYSGALVQVGAQR